jgi:hypothetical protein
LAQTVLLSVNLEPPAAIKPAIDLAPKSLRELRMRVLFSFGCRLDPVALRPPLTSEVRGRIKASSPQPPTLRRKPMNHLKTSPLWLVVT